MYDHIASALIKDGQRDAPIMERQFEVIVDYCDKLGWLFNKDNAIISKYKMAGALILRLNEPLSIAIGIICKKEEVRNQYLEHLRKILLAAEKASKGKKQKKADLIKIKDVNISNVVNLINFVKI